MSTERRNQGFSLLELVVVVGIIVLLAALVVPLLTRAGAAHRLRCEHNLRQLGTLLFQYAEQHGGRLPDFRYSRWCGAIGAIEGGVYTWESLPDGSTVWFIDERDGKIFRCGAQPLPLLNTQGVHSSYGGLGTNSFRSVSDFRDPSERVLLFEFEHDPAQVLESIGTPNKIRYAYDSFESESGPIRVAENHPGGGQILFVDLHVELVSGPKLEIGYWEEEYGIGTLSGRD